jgi:hypothetical protein
LTPQLVKRVHELYEELGREEVRAVQDWEKTEKDTGKNEPKTKAEPEAKAEPKPEGKDKPKPEGKDKPKPEPHE